MRVSTTGWAVSVVSAALTALLAPDAPRLARAVAGPSFPDASVAVASLIALALAAWSLLSVALILVAGSSRLVTAITPTMMRRALLVGAAGALAVGPAHASEVVAPQAPHHRVDGLPLPDRPDVIESAHRASTSSRPEAPSASDALVHVRRGDTLWAIAARTLPDSATAADIARATQQWHDANRDVIGDDPDLIFPAQLLTPPSGKDQS